MSRPSVLVCDDSPTMRLALRRTLTQGGVAVTGEAATGQEAVAMARSLKPDLISMDVMLPDLDGFQATRAILADGPARIVMVSAAGEALQTDLSFRALQCGALDLVEKPEAGEPDGLASWGRALAERLVLLAALPLGLRAPAGASTLPRRPFQSPHRVAAFGIAVSTGGPPALAQLLKGLDPGLSYPVLVAQHIAPGFAPGLARWLAGQTRLPVRLAAGGEIPAPGVVWLAADRTDLVLTGDGRLGASPNAQGLCPNGDRLLASLASLLGRNCAGAVLTGMGADGAQGLLAMKRAGALTFAQDSASCVVDGMPAAAVAAGGTELRLSLEELGFVMAELGR
ncbi:MAG TPA: chemotaxis protein CheB [bacterium]|nr:chemotaxis protein CheB [bacterium]